MYFCVNEFEVGVNDSIFSGNEQQKVYFVTNRLLRSSPFRRMTTISGSDGSIQKLLKGAR